MQSTTLWQLLQCEVEKGKVLWTAGQLAQQWLTGWSQMVILWPVIVHLSLTFNQTVTAWPVIANILCQHLLGTSVEDCCDKCSIVQCSVIWCTTL